jgi:hypothetical protein
LSLIRGIFGPPSPGYPVAYKEWPVFEYLDSIYGANLGGLRDENEKFRDHSNTHYSSSGYNLELTIGLQGVGLVARGVRWGWEQGLHNVLPTPHTYTRDKQPYLPRPDPAACCPSPFPVYLHQSAFILGEVAAGCSHHHMQLAA